MANAFGIRFVPPDYLVKLYKGFGNNLPLTNNVSSLVLPMPARYVIGTDGIIAYSEVNPDYTHRPDPSGLLPVLDCAAHQQGGLIHPPARFPCAPPQQSKV